MSNENEAVIGKNRYVAVPASGCRCDGCTFNSAGHEDSTCWLFPCMPQERDDGRFVIWVKVAP